MNDFDKNDFDNLDHPRFIYPRTKPNSVWSEEAY